MKLVKTLTLASSLTSSLVSSLAAPLASRLASSLTAVVALSIFTQLPVANAQTESSGLARFVESRSLTFIRPVSLFNWGYNGKFGGGRTARNPEAYRSARWGGAQSSFYADPANGGVYLAADPVVSRNYGNAIQANLPGNDVTSFVLTRVQVPAGLRVLKPGVLEESLPSNVRHELSAMGCSQTNLSEMAQDPRCQRIFETTLKSLRVVGLSYEWASSPLQGCRQRTDLTFIFFHADSSLIPQSQFAAFDASTSSRDPHAQEKALIQALFRDPQAQVFPGTPVVAQNYPWPALDGAQVPVDAYKRENILGCGAPALR